MPQLVPQRNKERDEEFYFSDIAPCKIIPVLNLIDHNAMITYGEWRYSSTIFNLRWR
jgi:hypothetical protein